MYNRRKTIALCLLLAGLLLLCAACSPDETPGAAPSIEPSAEPTTEPSVEPSIEPSADVSDDTIVTYSVYERGLLEESAENGDRPIVNAEYRSAYLPVLKSEEQLREVEALPDIETLDIGYTNIDVKISSTELRTISISDTFSSSDTITIDLSGCTALTDVSLSQGKAPRELKLPESVETLSMSKGLVEYVDYLSTLPNLQKLTSYEVFDLSLLNNFDSLEHLALYGSTPKNHWDLSVLTNEHIARLQLDSQETLDTFIGLAGLQSMYVNDRRISDISRIVEYAPNLEMLMINVSHQFIPGTEEDFHKTAIDSSNAELLDLLETPIPTEQLKTLVANGTTIRLWPDYTR